MGDHNSTGVNSELTSNDPDAGDRAEWSAASNHLYLGGPFRLAHSFIVHLVQTVLQLCIQMIFHSRRDLSRSGFPHPNKHRKPKISPAALPGGGRSEHNRLLLRRGTEHRRLRPPGHRVRGAAAQGEYSADRGSANNQLEMCRAYCGGRSAKPAWCDELPSPSLATVIGGCAGAVVTTVVVLIVVYLCIHRKSESSAEDLEQPVCDAPLTPGFRAPPPFAPGAGVTCPPPFPPDLS
jgi:hypothetical protein